MKILEGIIIPAVTPFEKDGRLSLDKLATNYEAWNRSKVQGYMCLGSNGELRSIDDDESLAVIRCASAHTSSDKVLIGGVGRESLQHTLSFIRRVQDAGIHLDYISALTPNYFAKLMTDEALVDYYETIADYSKYPLLLYCAPGFANGVCISPEVLKRLAAHPNIAGIKDTSSNMMESYMDAVGGRKDFIVLSGSLSTIMVCLERGGAGGVVSAANYFPDECARLVEIFRTNGVEKARAYHAALQGLARQTGGRGSVAGVKCCMNLVGLQGGYPRKPVQPISAEIKAEVREAVEKMKL